MKQHLFLSATAIGISLSLAAQNVFPSTGNVGIGTTTPLKLLHVKGAGAFGNQVTASNATRALNLADNNAVMRVLRVDPANAPAVELISRTSADGANVAYWDFYTQPSDKSFRIRDRVGGGSGLDRLTVAANGNVGIGTTAPNASSLLELTSVNKGILIPRMTQTQRNAIVSPAQGLLVFQTDATRGFYFYDGGWKQVTPPSQPPGDYAHISLGNLSVRTAINADLLPDVINTRALGSATKSWKSLYLSGQLFVGSGLFMHTKGFQNTFLGDSAGSALTTGLQNLGVGTRALHKLTTGAANTASGAFALYHTTTGSGNTATGLSALFNNTTGSHNTAHGSDALHENTGNYNTAIGSGVLFYNTTGENNTATGYEAMRWNTTGLHNTAYGWSALNRNDDGPGNTATGYSALYFNYAGGGNTANGFNALYNNRTGWSNNALGEAALYSNADGFYNTGIGSAALYSNYSGWGNTALGSFTDVAFDNLNNATAIGSSTTVDASDKVRIGNASVTSIGGQVNWTSFSDGRYKRNIREDVPGLAFINGLRPVTYNVDVKGLDAHYNKGRREGDGKAKKTIDEKMQAMMKQSQERAGKVVYNGFVAQEVEEAARKLKYDFSGVDKPQKESGLYGLRYSDFVVPLVKAVQELDAKTKEIDALKAEVAELRSLLLDLKNGRNTAVQVPGAYLEPASPNPARGTTTIRYGVPDHAASVRLTLTNAKGQVLKQISLSGRGAAGQVNLNTAGLPAGAYTYTLWVNEQQASSKQLVIAR